MPLRVTGVTRRFGPVTALADVSLHVPGGSVTALVGPNGSGKSTLIALAAGLLEPDDGLVTVAGRPAGTVEAARAVALVPDDPRGLDELTVREHVELVAALHGGGRAPRRAALLDRFDLGGVLDARLEGLSRGQRRRAALVAALALDAPLVLVDEATEALDAAAVASLGDELERVAARGAGVLVASHDLRFVRRVCDTVVRLRRGHVDDVSSTRCNDLREIDDVHAAV